MMAGSESIVMLWLERAADGTAAGAHLRGTRARVINSENVLVEEFADTESPDGREGYLRKSIRLAKLALQGVLSVRPRRVLVARFHPLILPVVIVWKAARGHVILSVQGAVTSAGDNEYRWLKGARWLEWLARKATTTADALIVGAPVIEPYVRKELAKPSTPVVSIPNGVFVSDYEAAGRETSPMKEPYAVFVGNLASWQGIDTLVAARRSSAWPQGLDLVVVGDGVDRKLVENVPGVIWLGRLPSQQARVWLTHALCAFSIQRSDLSVSEHGFWPFKMIESAAAGVPVVVSDVKGLSEAAVSLGNGVVVPPEDAEGTAVAVARIASDEMFRQRLSNAGRSNAGQFDWAAGSGALSDLIDEITG